MSSTASTSSTCPRCQPLPRGLHFWRVFHVAAVGLLLSLLAWQWTVYRTTAAAARDIQLAENQLWLETINRVPVAMLIVDADTGQLVGYSQGAKEIFGWTPQEVLGTPIYSFMPEEYAKDHAPRLRSAAVRRRLSSETLKLTCKMLRKDSVEPFLCSVTIRGVPTTDRYRFLIVVEKAGLVQEFPYKPREIKLPEEPVHPQPAGKPYADLLPPVKSGIQSPNLR